MPFRGGGFSPRNRAGRGGRDAARAGPAVAGGRLGRADPDAVPAARPLAIARALWRLAVSGELWAHLWRRSCSGWRSAGRSARRSASAVGFAVGHVHLGASPGMALVSALFPIPKIALVPLFIIWFGIGEGSKDRDAGVRRVLPDRDQHLPPASTACRAG